MKTISILLCVLFVVLTVSCGSDKVFDGKVYETYGLINKDNVKKDGIKYKPIWGNIIWGAILFETVIGPIYFYGFSMFEPVAKEAG